MALKINSASGSITLTAEDGSGNANVTLPRGGFVGSLSDLSITATAAEINKLDGVTASTTELNYVDISTLGTVEASKAVTADANGDVTFPDGEKAIFGAGADLQIYHDGSNSYIDDAATGSLSIRSNGAAIDFWDITNSQYFARLQTGGAATLYHGGTAKVATTSTGADISGTLTTDGVTVDGTLDIEEVFEKVEAGTSTTGTLNYNVLDSGIVNLTSNQTANRTINFRGNASNTLNSLLSTGQSVTSSILAAQGSTAYYFNAYQVDGTAVTPKWSGGSAPSAGNASGIDVYTFTIIKTADATFTVLASVTQYA